MELKLLKKLLTMIEKKKIKLFCLKEESLLGTFISEDIINEKTGKIYYEAGYEIDEEFFKFVHHEKINRINILKVDNVDTGPYIRNTLQLDKARSREEALFEIFKILRPGEPPTIETAEASFQ